MTVQAGAQPQEPIREGKYARIERERRFLLAEPPTAGAVTESRRIIDRYLPGTRLRLRRVDGPDSGAQQFKFTQKVPAGQPGHVRGLITNTYLSVAEYELLAALPANLLCKTRLSVPPLAIDVFEPPLHGLVLAEAEFTTDEAAQSFPLPPAATAEVTGDNRFTGGSLAQARRRDLLAWLGEYGIKLQHDG